MILASERGENYERSFWNWLEGRYSLTEKLMQGMNEIDTKSLSEWVEFDFHGTLRKEFRHINQENPGSRVRRNLYVSIYEKPTDSVSRIAYLRDTLIFLLRRAVIEVRDWVGSGSTIGQLIGMGILVDTRVHDENDFNHHVLVFEFDHMEQFTRATS